MGGCLSTGTAQAPSGTGLRIKAGGDQFLSIVVLNVAELPAEPDAYYIQFTVDGQVYKTDVFEDAAVDGFIEAPVRGSLPPELSIEVKDADSDDTVASGVAAVGAMEPQLSSETTVTLNPVGEIHLELTYVVEEEAEDLLTADMEDALVEQADPTLLEEEAEVDGILTMKCDDADAGDGFMAVKPWKGAIIPPTDWVEPEGAGEAPDASLEIEFAHGYTGWSGRNNAYFTADSTHVVYYTAALGVVLDMRARPPQQRFFSMHNDDIMASCMHPNRQVIATGEMGKEATIYVWNVADQTVLATLRGCQRGVKAMAFSPSGRFIAAIGIDEQHSVYVWDWATGALVGSEAGEHGNPYHMAWKNEKEFVVVGHNYLRFVEVTGSALRVRKGLFGTGRNRGTIQPLLSCAYLPSGTLAVGTQSGHLYFWRGASFFRGVKAHTGPVFSVFSDGSGLISGGRDGKVIQWSSRMSQENVMEDFDAVRSIDRIDTGELIIGTQANDLFHVTRSGIKTLIIQGHWKGELWGLATSPTNPEYVTVGDEGSVYKWSIDDHKCIQKAMVGEPARSIDVDASGTMVAVGTESGRVLILDYDSLEIKYEATQCNHKITVVVFSPDSSKLAIGTRQAIHVYSTDGLERIAVCTGMSSTVTHIDWEETSMYFRSNDQSYELLFWDGATGEQKTWASEFKDSRWARCTCVLGFDVQGIWTNTSDGTDINAVQRNRTEEILAASDDFSRVRLYKYPCTVERAAYVDFRGHSSHVTAIRFDDADSYLISCGGLDKTVIQWRFTVGEGEAV